ncbi:hypothetical protein BUE76_17220 [Cnuella takakiae]|nr:hypothetical protein BUE76_17220 [Cnuella takakiae]
MFLALFFGYTHKLLTMEKQTDKDQGTQPAANTSDNPKNPFREDAPEVEADPTEEAELEQQRKEALTERD